MISLVALVGVIAVATGCRGELPAALSAPDPVASRVRVVGSVQCEVQLGAGVTCRSAEGVAGGPGPSRAVVVSSADTLSWMLQTSNASYDAAASIYRLDLALTNSLSNALGTRDGVTSLGFKLFLHEDPVVTGWTAVPDGTTPAGRHGLDRADAAATVRILSPDGRQALLSSNQPYVFYPDMLAPGQTSAARTWRFHVPNSVEAFFFTVLLSAPMPGEPTMPPVVPNGFLIGGDSLAVLYAQPRQVYGGAQFGGPYPPDVVLVEFHASATQEERQAALDLVQGSVIGGGWGSYYVQVPMDGSTDGAAVAAVNRLQGLPQVRFAAPDLMGALVPLARPMGGDVTMMEREGGGTRGKVRLPGG